MTDDKVGGDRNRPSTINHMRLIKTRFLTLLSHHQSTKAISIWLQMYQSTDFKGSVKQMLIIREFCVLCHLILLNNSCYKKEDLICLTRMIQYGFCTDHSGFYSAELFVLLKSPKTSA